MNLSERAMSFVIRAYEGRCCAFEKDKPYVFHSLIVGMLLKYYGFNEEVQAAGFLHDIIGETDFTIEDISHLFGGRVASLVATSTEQKTDISWKESKNLIIKNIKDLPVDNMAVICADKVAELEDLRISFKKIGYEDFSITDVSKEELEWYYRGIYQSLASTFEGALLDRLLNDMYDVFKRGYIPYIDDIVLSKEEIIKRNKLAGYQEDLFKLRKIVGETKPYIIEFVGTPRSGKSTMMRVFKDFFTQGGFRVNVEEEYYSKSEYLLKQKSLSTVEKNLLISSAIKDDLMQQIVGDQDVIMVENSMFNCLVYMQLLFNQGKILQTDFESYVDYYLPEIETLINHVVVCYASPITSIKREVSSNLSLDVSAENVIEDYNDALSQCEALLKGGTIVDTTKITSREATLMVAETLLPIMRSDYILKLRNFINENREG